MSSMITFSSPEKGADTNPQRQEQNAYGQGYEWTPEQAAAQEEGWKPAVDIFETTDEIVVRTELPGVKKDSLKVNLENNILMITGNRTQAQENLRNVLRVERPFGAFRRSFTLPSNIDQGSIRSEFSNGLLNIHLPKRAETKPRQIEVKIN